MDHCPGYDEAYGFDLERSDWVSPHGQGQITDMLFTFSGERISEDEFSMKMEIVFPGEGNGLVEVPVSALSRSNLLLGQTAPWEGYNPLFVDYFSNEFVNRILRPSQDEPKRNGPLLRGIGSGYEPKKMITQKVESKPDMGKSMDKSGVEWQTGAIATFFIYLLPRPRSQPITGMEW